MKFKDVPIGYCFEFVGCKGQRFNKSSKNKYLADGWIREVADIDGEVCRVSTNIVYEEVI